MAVRVSVKLKGVKSTFQKLDRDTTKLVNGAQRIAAFQALSDLQFTTPVDQGRARGSWMTTKVSGQAFDSLTGTAPIALLGPISSSEIEKLYLTNGAPYIQDLNAGSSAQAPARFIENSVSKYFNTKGNFVKII